MTMNIDEIKKQVQSLNEDERKQLLSDLQLEHYEKGDYISNIQEDKEVKTRIHCPYCSSEEFISRGSHKGVKKYHCKNCKKYFNSNSGTALYGIHKKNKWQQYIECMNQGWSLRKSAQKVGISYRTAFIWRHKILSTLKEAEPSRLGGIVEADETYFPKSEKGNRKLNREPRKRGDARMIDQENKIPVVVVTDRRGNTLLRVAGTGTLKRESLRSQITGKFEPDTILCTDGALVYKGLANQEGIRWVVASHLSRPIAKNRAYNIQSVNQLHGELKQFMAKFKGVSTKYLQNYMFWFMHTKRKISESDKIKQWIWFSATYTSALKAYLKMKI
ncbi:MAG: IS1595 family transposase [bacterium]